LRVLFFVAKGGFPAKHFEWSLQLMAERGDRIHVAIDDFEQLQRWGSVVTGLADRFDNVTYGEAPAPDPKSRVPLRRQRLRDAIDLLAFAEPPLADAVRMRRRVEAKAPRWGRRLASMPGLRRGPGSRLLRALLRSLERSGPADPRVRAYVEDFAPDVVLLTPLITLRPRSPQFDYLRAAMRLGIPTGLLVASWDNLTTKGLIHEIPDFVTVWNEGMKREAVELHGVPPERVLVTGAPSFDHWFSWQPSTSREQFCAKVGLDPARPFLLWMCSSMTVAERGEMGAIENWLERMRSRDGAAGGPQVLVRPYPSNTMMKAWGRYDRSRLGSGVSVWPVLRDKPIEDDARSDFFDSIHHSVAVVGINTSALVEAAIVGRPIYTLLLPDFEEVQEGMLHFQLISEFAGGVLTTSRSFEEHASQVEAALAAPADDPRREEFVRAFVRPHGLDRPASEILVEAIDAALGRVPPKGPRSAAPAQAASAATFS
jgi:hypothetical protein